MRVAGPIRPGGRILRIDGDQAATVPVAADLHVTVPDGAGLE